MRHLPMPQMNADIFPFLFGNGVGWLVYGAFTHNVYIVVGNFSHVPAGMFYILTGCHHPPQVNYLPLFLEDDSP